MKNEWQKLVAKLSKENPGKPLGAILPLASKIYKKAKTTGLTAKTPEIKTKKSVKKARKTAKRRKN
jgi:hypothetical protein